MTLKLPSRGWPCRVDGEGAVWDAIRPGEEDVVWGDASLVNSAVSELGQQTAGEPPRVPDTPDDEAEEDADVITLRSGTEATRASGAQPESQPGAVAFEEGIRAG